MRSPATPSDARGRRSSDDRTTLVTRNFVMPTPVELPDSAADQPDDPEREELVPALATESDEPGARALLGKLNRVAAPPDLASRVPDLIQRRSGGRFFNKRRLAD